MSDIPRLPPPRPRPRAVPPAPVPVDPTLLAVAALSVRVGDLEARMGTLFKRSVVTIVASDIVIGLAKTALEFFGGK